MKNPDKVPDRPTVPEVRALASAYYRMPGNSVGGCLHVVLDDGNLEDGSVASCRDYAAKCDDAAGVELAEKLLQMTVTQRKKVYRTFDAGYFEDRDYDADDIVMEHRRKFWS
jgi:hypothetical protein